MKKISVVIPCYNEEDNIELTYNEITKTLSFFEKKYSWEIIFTDNDSQDLTQFKIKKICQKDKKVKAIFNTRNFGVECNTINGFFVSNGDCVIWICCDLQEPPELIPEMIQKWENGEKLVWGEKIRTEEKGIIYLCRRIYYFLIAKFAEVPQYQNVIGWGLYDKEIINELRLLNDPNPILRNIVPNLGYKPYLIPYKQRKRKYGTSSYNFYRYFNTALNSVIHTTKIPMKIMIYLGIFSGCVSFIIGCFYLFYKILYWDSFALGLAPLIIMLSFFFSVLIFFLGIIGEYILAILDRVSFTKYVVEKERINFDTNGELNDKQNL